MDSLTAKTAVITGAASGIGEAFAERFAREGMSLVLADIDASRLDDVATRCRALGSSVVASRCDTAREDDVEALAAAAMESFGGVHVLCNNAGIGGITDPWNGPMSDWRRIVDVNVFGVVHGIRSFLPIMTAQGEGHIVNTASMAGLLAVPGAPGYNATKHAVVAISEGLYLELKAVGSPVEVSVLCPYWVRTRLLDNENAAIDNPIAALTREFIRASIDNDSIEPSAVADQVVTAITERRFWILTHPEVRQLPVARMERAAAQINPKSAIS